MSSILRRHSQIAPSIRFMRYMTPEGGWGYYSRTSIEERLASCPIPYTLVGNTVDVASLEDLSHLYFGNYPNWTGIWDIDYIDGIPAGALVKDLGKTIRFTINGMLAIQWRLAQIVSGSSSEGVPQNWLSTGAIWVVTYVASSYPTPLEEKVHVARIG